MTFPLFFSFTASAVASGESVRIIATLQDREIHGHFYRVPQAVRGERLVVGALCAPHFLLENILIECDSDARRPTDDAHPTMDSQFAAPGGLPALMFAADLAAKSSMPAIDLARPEEMSAVAVPVPGSQPLSFDLLQKGQSVVLVVRNCSTEPRDFDAALVVREVPQ